jgi:pimeloyl-ACP methyl ester carboxylesterase
MPFIQRPACPSCGARVRIYYEEHGRSSSHALYPSVQEMLAPVVPSIAGAPTRPIVLLTHGFGSGSRLWEAQVPALVAAGFHVVTWDMCGHGKSDAPEAPQCYSKQHQVNDITAVLMAATSTAPSSSSSSSAVPGATPGRPPFPPVFLCGHSMGGYDNLLYYYAHPDRVAGLLLYATGPGFAKDAARLQWNETAEKMAKAYDKDGLGALRGSDKHKGHRSAVGLALSCRHVFAQHENDPLYASLGGPLAPAHRLGEVAVPVSIVVGERDRGFLGACKMMESKIAGAVLRVIPGAGHMVCEQDPQGFNQVRSRVRLCVCASLLICVGAGP